MVDKYEAGRKKHMAWHKAQGDPWTWNVYEVTTGPDTGCYLIACTNHQWADFDTWTAKFGDGDTADANVSMAGTQAGSQMSYWTQLNATEPPATGQLAAHAHAFAHHLQREAGPRRRGDGGDRQAQRRADCRQYPLHSIWYRLTNGGATPAYAVVTPRANMASFGKRILARSRSNWARPARTRW